MTVTQGGVSLTSRYIPARDGTGLAVDIWLPADCAGAKLPTIFTLTRYWRSAGFKEDTLAWQKSHEEAVLLTTRGYAYVVADSRGSGASFGTRDCEFSEAEIGDIEVLMAWIAGRPWSNGNVASTGTSYTGNTAFCCASGSPPALKVVVPYAADFDVYAQLVRPGGLENFFTRDWGAGVRALDQNDHETLLNNMSTPPPEPIAVNFTGVRPVDEDTDGSLLMAAVGEHADNFNVGSIAAHMDYRDQKDDTVNLLNRASVYFHRDNIEKSSLPIHYRTGWLDAGTPQGALSLFNTFSNPKRVIIGPWNHGNNYLVNPYINDKPVALPLEEKVDLTVGSLAPYVRDDDGDSATEMGVLEYYTYAENVWKTTRVWPLPETRMTRFYLHAGHTLVAKAPGLEGGEDHYKVDPTATTGATNRWHTNLGGGPVLYPDRREEDKKLLIYETQPLATDTEITGHPVLRLFLALSQEDGDVIVYLEDVGPDGTVYYITEGCLRVRHRKVSPPPYAFAGPYHSFRREDAEPLVPETVTELMIGLFPTSVLFRKGHRIRLAISGADKGTFLPMGGVENAQWRIQRNSRHPSYLELPIIPRS
ncbi:MAG: CocE/NonD family hydrolase [Deltaproteobacteria bacterium]|nr:CocE/NonD family hydrolase [Deltaproteobacteria bacterium]